MVTRIECIFSPGLRSMSSPAVASSGNGGIFSLIDTHCHVHVPDDGAETLIAAAASSARNAAKHANRCCSQDYVHSASRQDLKLAQLDRCNEKGEPPPHFQTKRVVHITMGIREQDWASAVSYGADNLRLMNLFNLQSQEKSRPQTSVNVATVSGNEAEETSRASSDPVPFFQFGLGLHPWYAHSRSENWFRHLTCLLEEHPRAIVGEIGLDKVARTPDTRKVEWDYQLQVFKSQMALASALSRPVSVHCVKAYGKLIEVLREGEKGSAFSGVDPAVAQQGLECPRGVRLPPRIALHSYTGSVEVTKEILRLEPGCRGEVFFGFSAAVNMRGDREEKRLVEVLRVIPDSQVLIETDRRTPPDSAEELLRVCGAISQAKGVSIEEAGMLANRNASRFLQEIALPGRKDV